MTGNEGVSVEGVIAEGGCFCSAIRYRGVLADSRVHFCHLGFASCLGKRVSEIGSIDEEAPSIQLIRSPEHKHTDLDIAALIPSVGLEAVARAFAKIIDGANELSLAELLREPVPTTN